MKCGMRSEICHKICKKINELYYFIDKKYIIHIMGACGSFNLFFIIYFYIIICLYWPIIYWYPLKLRNGLAVEFIRVFLLLK